MKLTTCPACKGKKIVDKTSDGKVCYYADRTTIIRSPCHVCNGNGVVTQEKWEKWNGENR